MSKSKEIAELLNAEITRTVHLDVMHHEAAAHILAQDAEIELLKADIETRQRSFAALKSATDDLATERDQARDALRVAVEAMEDFDYDKRIAAIQQAKEAL